MNCLQIFVIARLDRAIQRIELDSPVKPENDSIEFLSITPCALGAGFLTKNDKGRILFSFETEVYKQLY